MIKDHTAIEKEHLSLSSHYSKVPWILTDRYNIHKIQYSAFCTLQDNYVTHQPS